MKTIWKFPFNVVSPLSISMPSGAEILAVQNQNGTGCLWALVDPQAVTELRYFDIFGTGHPIHENQSVDREYLGTFQQGPFVWHVFERIS